MNPIQKRLTAVALLTLILSGPAFAQLFNGDFSSGLTFWSATGDVAHRPSDDVIITNASVANDDDGLGNGALNQSGFEVRSLTDLATDLSVPVASLDPDAVNNIFGTEGSAIYQTFSLPAGLFGFTVQYQILTNDTLEPDSVFYVVNGVVTFFDDASSATTPSSSGFNFETGLLTLTAFFTPNPTTTLGFGIIDTGDFDNSSALILDNVRLIPEPGVLALTATGLVGLMIVRRRRSGK